MIEQKESVVRQDLEKLSRRSGHFEGFNIVGTQLRGLDGIVSWNIDMRNSDGDTSYWVTSKQFYWVGMHMFDPDANGATTFAIGPPTEPSEAERKAVESAQKFWRENPELLAAYPG